MKVIDNELLSKYLEKADLNYSDLSRETDISRNTIYNIADGKNCPSHTVMSILTDFLQISPEDFLAIFFANINFKKEFSHHEPTR